MGFNGARKMAHENSFQLHSPRSTLMAAKRYICCFFPLFVLPDGCNDGHLSADGALDFRFGPSPLGWESIAKEDSPIPGFGNLRVDSQALLLIRQIKLIQPKFSSHSSIRLSRLRRKFKCHCQLFNNMNKYRSSDLFMCVCV